MKTVPFSSPPTTTNAFTPAEIQVASPVSFPPLPSLSWWNLQQSLQTNAAFPQLQPQMDHLTSAQLKPATNVVDRKAIFSGLLQIDCESPTHYKQFNLELSDSSEEETDTDCSSDELEHESSQPSQRNENDENDKRGEEAEEEEEQEEDNDNSNDDYQNQDLSKDFDRRKKDNVRTNDDGLVVRDDQVSSSSSEKSKRSISQLSFYSKTDQGLSEEQRSRSIQLKRSNKTSWDGLGIYNGYRHSNSKQHANSSYVSLHSQSTTSDRSHVPNSSSIRLHHPPLEHFGKSPAKKNANSKRESQELLLASFSSSSALAQTSSNHNYNHSMEMINSEDKMSLSMEPVVVVAEPIAMNAQKHGDDSSKILYSNQDPTNHTEVTTNDHVGMGRSADSMRPNIRSGDGHTDHDKEEATGAKSNNQGAKSNNQSKSLVRKMTEFSFGEVGKELHKDGEANNHNARSLSFGSHTPHQFGSKSVESEMGQRTTFSRSDGEDQSPFASSSLSAWSSRRSTRSTPSTISSDQRRNSSTEEISSQNEGSQTTRSSSSSQSSNESFKEWEDSFPFEENVFALAQSYDFIKRVVTNPHVVVYKALKRDTNQCVAIKISQVRDLAKVITTESAPKEVRILTTIQKGPTINPMRCWYCFPKTNCYVIVSDWLPNDDIETCIFRHAHRERKVQKYMYDVLRALHHLHTECNVLYRDIKPSNILWDDTQENAFLIDFDVSTFYSADNRHRTFVGTDGYFAPEALLIQKHANRSSRSRKRYEADVAQFLQQKGDEERRHESNTTHPANLLKIEFKSKSKTKSTENNDNNYDDDEGISYKDYERLCDASGIDITKGYGLEVDIWAAGILFAQMLLEIPENDISHVEYENWTNGAALFHQIQKQHSVFISTSQKLQEKIKNHLKLTREDREVLHFIKTLHPSLKNPHTIELLKGMLQIHPSHRLTAAQCLSHPYFTHLGN